MRHPSFRGLRGLVLSLLVTNPAWGAEAPALWGYGVKTCADFVAVAPAPSAATDLGGEGFLRYREWLAGLVTGLNLATGRDVLAGAELDAALARIRVHCVGAPKDDFFNASLALFRSIGLGQAKPKAGAR